MRKPNSGWTTPSVEPIELRQMLSGWGSTTHVMTRLTRYGDAVLDGVVSLVDFNHLAANFAQPRAPKVGLTDNGTFIVTGTKGADRIVVDAALLDSMRVQHPQIRVKRVHVDAGAGDDAVEMKVGLPATIIGGKGNDTLTGGGRADHISGGDGFDHIKGGGGDDLLEGLGYPDEIFGGAGNDRIFGGAGEDGLSGGSGDDTLHAGAGGGNCWGDDGNDLLYGSASYDGLHGGPGHDRFKCRDGVSAVVDRIFTGPAGDRDRILGMDETDVVVNGTYGSG